MKRTLPGINAGSMADIAFLLLLFFLVTTTIENETGLLRKLPPVYNGEPIKQLNWNVLDVWVNPRGDIMFEGDEVSLKELKNLLQNAIANKLDLKHLPEKKMKYIPLLGEVLVSKQVISLKCEKSTAYDTYIFVQDQLAGAINELREKASKKYFGTSFKKLLLLKETDKINAIKTLYPMRISEAESSE